MIASVYQCQVVRDVKKMSNESGNRVSELRKEEIRQGDIGDVNKPVISYSEVVQKTCAKR